MPLDSEITDRGKLVMLVGLDGGDNRVATETRTLGARRLLPTAESRSRCIILPPRRVCGGNGSTFVAFPPPSTTYSATGVARSSGMMYATNAAIDVFEFLRELCRSKGTIVMHLVEDGEPTATAIGDVGSPSAIPQRSTLRAP